MSLYRTFAGQTFILSIWSTIRDSNNIIAIILFSGMEILWKATETVPFHKISTPGNLVKSWHFTEN